MLLTAAAVAVSAAPIAFRIVALMMMIPVFMAYTALRAAMAFAGGSGGGGVFFDNNYLKILLWMIPAAALYIYFFLELAASKIAPLAENHAVRKRILALLLCVAIDVAGLFFDYDIMITVTMLSIPIVGFVVVEALCENLVSLPGLYRPFALRGFLARLAGRLLYPGWATGVIFAAVAFALMTCGFWCVVPRLSSTVGSPPSPQWLMTWRWAVPLTFFAVISPLPILQLFPRFKKRFWPYLLVQSLSILLLIIGLIIADSPNNKGVLDLLAPIPTAALFAFTAHNDEGGASLLKVALITDAVLMAWVLFLVYRQLRIVRKLERLSLGEEESSSPNP
jgi:hypothetical protein